MNLNKLPQTTELKLDHLIEEASEVIKACIKIKRFGVNARRLKELALEVDDVVYTHDRYTKAL